MDSEGSQESVVGAGGLRALPLPAPGEEFPCAAAASLRARSGQTQRHAHVQKGEPAPETGLGVGCLSHGISVTGFPGPRNRPLDKCPAAAYNNIVITLYINIGGGP